jgi:Fe2+ or Zn2+ uptake regulation protein
MKPMDDLPPDIKQAIHRVINRTGAPVTAEAVRNGLPAASVSVSAVTRVLREMAKTGAVYEWRPSGKEVRFWWIDPEEHCRRTVLKLLSDHVPVSRQYLEEALVKRLFGYSPVTVKRLLRNVLKHLTALQWVYEYPPKGRGEVTRYGFDPPALPPYYEEVHRAMESVRKKLRAAGVSDQRLFRVERELFGEGAGLEAAETFRPSDRVEPAVYRAILDKLMNFGPSVRKGRPVSIADLRKALPFSKGLFDRAVLDLFLRGEANLHRHMSPGEVNESERELLVTDKRGNLFVEISIRDPSRLG